MKLMAKYPAAVPAKHHSSTVRRPKRSLSQPPIGRAKNVVAPKLAPRNPASANDNPNFSLKNSGRIDTTANSDPKVMR